MKEFFYPKTIAVIGVSESPDNMGRNIVANLIEFNYDGIIYEVGYKGGTLFGRRIYRSVSDIPDQIDLAVILTPAKTVPDILKECGGKGVRCVIIESAGFREFGPDGKKTEDELLKVARQYDIKFIGPNCIGVMNLHNGLALSFTSFKNVFRKGGISLVTQSGGVGISYLNVLASENLGIAKFASIGNKLVINENDLLSYFIDDPETEIVCLYLEGISDGRRLMEIARKSSKPILLHKSNIGKEAKAIAKSHTASLSSDDAVVSAALKQAGIARFKDHETLVNYLKILPLPRLTGNRLAILSRSGGHAVIAADACEEAGFTLAPFDAAFIKDVEQHFRAHVISLTNPLDLGDLFDYELYIRIVEQTITQPNVDGLVFLHTYFSATEGEASRALFAELEKISYTYKKPIAICVATDEEELYRLRQKLPQPVFTSPSDAIYALALARDFRHEMRPAPANMSKISVEKDKAEKIINACVKDGRSPLLGEALDILSAYGIPVVKSVLVEKEDEAAEEAKKLGYPVAMKIVSPTISHKTDLGGVQLNIRNEDALRQSFSEMMANIKKRVPGAAIEGVIVQPMISGGRELIIGAKRDPNFGPTVMVGLGGIFVEIFRDTALRVVPFDEKETDQMFAELRGYPILTGARGEKGYDLAKAKDVVARLSLLISNFPQISEVDLNPFRVLPEGEGGFCLDARMVFSK